MEKAAYSTLTIDKKFEECYKLYRQQAYEKKGNSVFQRLHDAFYESKQKCNNCFGCSIQVNTQLVSNYLKKYPNFKDVRAEFGSYILLQSLIIERLETILYMLQIPQPQIYQEFPIFKQIKAWATLFKPHTTFIPRNKVDFIFDNSETLKASNQDYFIVSQALVIEYYEKKISRRHLSDSATPEILNSKDNSMLIVLPNIAELTQQICQAYDKFIGFVLSNKEYQYPLTN